MTIEQQRDVLDHTIQQLTEFTGKAPRGHSEFRTNLLCVLSSG